ncbi:Y+L amino acid transporter 1 isoform X2 [Nematostella vectensis]|uniref:Y+L amino acid transporter 1 isoform X2 n=1 Tax=Nematostella vectensis TaxID=45351 RepID=UPI00207749D1|nr:Y+L amino acid transporter 1 isoform X2 [Nematostella vectensis]
MTEVSGEPVASVDAGNGKKSEEFGLRRDLGLCASISLSGGAMVGSGIFISAQWVLVYSGSVGMSLLIWLLCAVVSIFGALVSAELTLTFGKCGGCSERWDIKVLQKILGVGIIYFLMFMNMMSARVAARVQIVFTVGKALALAIIIITGVVRFAQGYTTGAFDQPFKGSVTDVSQLGLAFQSGLWAYAGWDIICVVVEEVKHPSRNLIFAVMGSITFVTLLYLLVNIAYLAVLTVPEVKASLATAVSFAQRMYGTGVQWLIPLCVSATVFGTMNARVYGMGRMYFAAAREGHLPRALAMLHTDKRTPIPAMLYLAFIITAILIPRQTSVRMLLKILGFASWMEQSLLTIGLLWTRYKRPDLARPFKPPVIIPIIFLTIALYLAITPIVAAPLESLFAYICFFAGIPIYCVLIRYKLQPKWLIALFGKHTCACV